MVGDFFEGKQAARTELERRRRSLSPQEVRSKGEEARKRLLALPFFKGVIAPRSGSARPQVEDIAPKGAPVIASYAPQPFELAPPPGVLPRVVRGTRELVFHEVMGPLVAGTLGILTPRPEWPVATAIDVFVVPAVGLGLDGSRLGRGAGYYDATLVRFPNAVKVGFTFECCVVDRLPVDPWDVRMDWVVTEARAIRVPTGS